MDNINSCFLITITTDFDGLSKTHIDSIWLEENGSYGRAMELVTEMSQSGNPLPNEHIASNRGVPYIWYWKSADFNTVVAVERCKVGTPMIRWIDPEGMELGEIEKQTDETEVQPETEVD
jgi:hypothetical protein